MTSELELRRQVEFLTTAVLFYLLRRKVLARGWTPESPPHHQTDGEEASERLPTRQQTELPMQEVSNKARVEEVTDGWREQRRLR